MNKRKRKKKAKKIQAISQETLQKRTPKQLARYSDEHLRKTYQNMRATANKRLNRLKESGFEKSQIYLQYRESFAQKPSTMSSTEIYQSLLEVRTFLGDKTSTVRGMKKLVKDLQESAKEYNKKLEESEEETEETEETEEIEEITEPEIETVTDFIDWQDENQLQQFGDFMDLLRYNINTDITYNIEELKQLWDVWQENKYYGDFNFASNDLYNAFNKLLESKNTITMTDPKRENRTVSERKRINKIIDRIYGV